MPHVELPQAEFKVVLLGDTGTGKTSLVLRFCEGYYRQTGRSSTVGAFFLTKRITVGQMTCKMLLWDTAGQEPFRRLAVTYYQHAAAAILTFDVSHPQSLWRMRANWLKDVQRHLQESPQRKRMVLAICACKTDLPSAPGLEEEAQHLAEQVGALYMRTSAKNDQGVHELFSAVCARVLDYHKEGTHSASSPLTTNPTAATTAATAAAATTTTRNVGLTPPTSPKTPNAGDGSHSTTTTTRGTVMTQPSNLQTTTTTTTTYGDQQGSLTRRLTTSPLQQQRHTTPSPRGDYMMDIMDGDSGGASNYFQEQKTCENASPFSTSSLLYLGGSGQQRHHQPQHHYHHHHHHHFDPSMEPPHLPRSTNDEEFLPIAITVGPAYLESKVQSSRSPIHGGTSDMLVTSPPPGGVETPDSSTLASSEEGDGGKTPNSLVRKSRSSLGKHPKHASVPTPSVICDSMNFLLCATSHHSHDPTAFSSQQCIIM